MTCDAARIYQANLDAVSRALWDTRPDILPGHIAMPGSMSTADAEMRLETPDMRLAGRDDDVREPKR